MPLGGYRGALTTESSTIALPLYFFILFFCSITIFVVSYYHMWRIKIFNTIKYTTTKITKNISLPITDNQPTGLRLGCR